MTTEKILENSIILSIKRSEERANLRLNYFKKNNIDARIWYGYDGAITGLQTDFLYEIDNPNYKIGAKTVNMALSHYSIWQYANFAKLSTCAIFEDDACFVTNWKNILDENIKHLPDDWDLFFIGSCSCMSYPNKIHIKENLYKTDHVLCSHAYIINNTAYETLLKYQKIWAPIDIALTLGPVKELNTYALFPTVIKQDGNELID